MRLAVASSNRDLEDLWQDWDILWDAVPDASPFLSPAWLQAWWNAFGTGQPVVVTLWDHLHLVGVLPLYRLDSKLLPMGVGVSDYTGVLLRPDVPRDTSRDLLQAALNAGGTTRCDLPDLPPNCPLLSAAPLPGWSSSSWNGPPCPVLALTPEPAIPKAMRRDIRQARHRGDRAGGWSIEAATTASFGHHFGHLMDLHSARWSERGETGVLCDPDVLAFHRSAGPALIDRRILRLQTLYFNSQPAAVIYALLNARDIFFYLSGFDPARAFQSPSTILLSHLIDEAVCEGRHEAHFLRGGERYKYAWGGVDRWNTGMTWLCE